MKYQTKYLISEYIGKKINYLTVVGEAETLAPDSSKQWTFKCTCGNLIEATPYRIISGHKKSCGCMRYKTPQQLHKHPTYKRTSRINPDNYLGQKSNRLTVIGIKHPIDKGKTLLECKCDCGNTTYVLPYQFDKGLVKSCGCARFGHSEQHKGNTYRRTHNLSGNRFYKKWNDMIRRCHNPNEPAYRHYGAKGITVCDEWRQGPEAFIRWCEETHPDGPLLTIDRKDGKKGYCPDNCRWVSQQTQMRNIKTNRNITLFGKTQCLTDWCKELHISAGSIYRRVNKGFSFEDAILDITQKSSYARNI